MRGQGERLLSSAWSRDHPFDTAGPGIYSRNPDPGVPPCESKADPVATKRKQEPGLDTWIIVTFALTIGALAAVALLSDERLNTRRNAEIEDVAAPEALKNHDRGQIDKSSRDQLREILRKSGNGD